MLGVLLDVRISCLVPEATGRKEGKGVDKSANSGHDPKK